jgi:hypothetical protein
MRSKSIARQPVPIASVPVVLTGRVPNMERARPAIRSLAMIKTATGRNARPAESGDSPTWPADPRA